MPKFPAIHAAGYVEHGKIHLDNRILFDAALLRWKGRITLTVDSEEMTRSDRAHRYYFGVVLKLIAAHTGHSIEELHEVYKAEWNSKTIFWTNTRTGEMTERRVAQSTTRLKVDEFYDYVENVRMSAASDLGVVTPDPDPEYWKKPQPAAEAIAS